MLPALLRSVPRLLTLFLFLLGLRHLRDRSLGRCAGLGRDGEGRDVGSDEEGEDESDHGLESFVESVNSLFTLHRHKRKDAELVSRNSTL